MSHFRRFRFTPLLLLVVVAIASPLRADSEIGRSHIPQLDDNAAHRLEVAARDFQEGRWLRGIEILQELREKLRERTSLIAAGGTDYYRMYKPSEVQLRDLLDSLPDEALEVFRKRFDTNAEALYRHGLAARDVAELMRCAEAFPLCAAGRAAAMAAGDILLEQGRPFEARRAWSLIDPRGAPAAELEALARRRSLLVELLAYPAIPDQAPRDSALPEGDARPDAPALFQSLKRAWSLPLERLPYSSTPVGEPCVVDGELIVPTPAKLVRVELATGKALQDYDFPRQRGQLDRFINDDRWRAGVVHGIGRGGGVGSERGQLFTSYINSAGRGESFRGFAIRNPVPRRALCCFDRDYARSPRWTSNRAANDRLAGLSFNSPPIVVDGRLYALGWNHTGFVNAYVVCIDIAGGELLWSTLLAGNQIELTVFGELAREPLLGDLVHHDGMLYASTNLGVVSALYPSDGRMAWLTEYSQRPPPVRRWGRRRGRYRFFEVESWEKNPVVMFADRMITAPLDSPWVLSVDLQAGKIIQHTSREIVGENFLGRHGNSLVSIDSSRAMLQDATDLTSPEQVIYLDNYPAAPPKVVADGLLYRSPEGIFLHPISDNEAGDEVTLWDAPDDDTVDMGRNGSLLVLEDRILLVTPTAITCFVAGKEPPERRF